MNENLFGENLTPWGDDVWIVNDDDVVVITEANSYDPGPSEAHRRYLEKKYGPPIPRPKTTEKREGEAPPENMEKKSGEPPPA